MEAIIPPELGHRPDSTVAGGDIGVALDEEAVVVRVEVDAEEVDDERAVEEGALGLGIHRVATARAGSSSQYSDSSTACRLARTLFLGLTITSAARERAARSLGFVGAAFSIDRLARAALIAFFGFVGAETTARRVTGVGWTAGERLAARSRALRAVLTLSAE